MVNQHLKPCVVKMHDQSINLTGNSRVLKGGQRIGRQVISPLGGVDSQGETRRGKGADLLLVILQK
jgi:hypothetical protein